MAGVSELVGQFKVEVSTDKPLVTTEKIAKKSTSVLANEYPIAIGGLFRCCIATVDQNEEPAEEGDVSLCPHCGGETHLLKNAKGVLTWQWKELEKK